MSADLFDDIMGAVCWVAACGTILALLFLGAP